MARDLNGSSQYITYTLTATQMAITKCTFSWWEYLDSNGQYRRPYDFDSTTHDWRMEFDDGWGYVFVIGWSTNDGKWSISKPSTGAWHNITVTYDGTSVNNDPIIYLNGVPQTVTERATPSGSITLPTGTAWIGVDDGSSQYFDGRLAEFAFWNRVLSPTDCKLLGEGHIPLTFSSGIVFYAPLLGNDSPEPDIVGGTTGTVTGATQITHPTVIYPDVISRRMYLTQGFQ